MKKNRVTNRNERKCLWSIVILAFFIMSLAACGGGGGGHSAQGPTVTEPLIIAVNPTEGATEVALNPPRIQATFNKDMDSSTLNTDTFTLVSPSGVKISGTVSYDEGTKVVTFTPFIRLAPLTTYTATITDVKDKDSHPMNNSYSWSFTTITGFWAYDFVSNGNYFVSATRVGEGNHCVVYLEQDWTVDQNTINSIISQFDNAIYPNETSTFGSEPNPGIDNDTKIFIFLLDIKDGYTQGSSSYISGYFNPLDEHDISISLYSNQKEIFYMDIKPGIPGNLQFLRTLSHEFQHMINWQQKTNLLGVYEDTWLDEAMSEVAPVVCGYGPDYKQVYTYELLPWDSLVIWNDTLYDYATVYMWAQYMKDRVTDIDSNGNGVFWNINHTNNVGINAVNSALSAIGYGKDFTGIFGDWSIANYLGLTTISGHPEWSYTTIHTEAGYITTIGTLPGLPVDDADHINAATVGGLHMWGLDYFKFTKTGQGTVTWKKTDLTDEAAFIDASNNTVTLGMTSGNPYPYINIGILIARNPTDVEKWTANGGGTITHNSLLAGDRIMGPQFSKSYSNPVLEKESSVVLTPKAILSRVISNPVAKTISAKTGRPISLCVDRFFKEREKILRQKLMKEK
jgi:archaellin